MNKQHTNSNPELPDGVRTLISLLLFVHFFALSVAILAHAGQSELTDQIRRRVPLLQPYLRRVWMDHGYTYSDYVNPRHDVRLDTQFVIQCEYEYSDGSTRHVRMPDETIRLGLRRQRYLTLARNLAATVGNDIEAEYASMVAAGLIAEETDAKSLRLACIERFTSANSGEPPDDPNALRGDDGVYSAVVYRCQAWRNEETGDVEIRKEEETRRVAPVTRQVP